jgi:hypothetical protein
MTCITFPSTIISGFHYLPGKNIGRGSEVNGMRLGANNCGGGIGTMGTFGSADGNI